MPNIKRIALITGASSGIGKETARIFLENGFVVLNFDKNKSDDKDIENYLINLEDIQGIKKKFNLVKKKYKNIHILINNAAVTISDNLLDYKISDWNKSIAINLTAPFVISKLFASLAIKNKHKASIVNVSSIGGKLSFPNNPAYQATKAALIHLSKSMAYDLAKHNIRVNNIIPGYVNTPMNKKSWQNKKLKYERSKRNLLNRWGDPKEIAEVIFFISNEKSSFITGADIAVDGGWLTKGI